MPALTRDHVEFAGVQLAVLAAALHLLWGLPRAVVYLRAGRFPDPRPFLFVASALVVVVGVVWLARAGPRRPLLAGLAAVMAGYLLGYAWWHLGSHGGGLFPGLRPLRHDEPAVSLLLDHLAADAFVLATVAVETTALAVLLGVLATDD